MSFDALPGKVDSIVRGLQAIEKKLDGLIAVVNADHGANVVKSAPVRQPAAAHGSVAAQQAAPVQQTAPAPAPQAVPLQQPAVPQVPAQPTDNAPLGQSLAEQIIYNAGVVNPQVAQDILNSAGVADWLNNPAVDHQDKIKYVMDARNTLEA